VSESSFARSLRDGVRKKAKELGHKVAWTRLECSLAGIPDVVFSIDGNHHFIELKCVANFPKREATPIRLPHFTADQKWWLKQHGEAGEYCWVFLKVQKEYFLYHWNNLDGLGDWNKKELFMNCDFYAKGRMDYEGFIKEITDERL
jgi:hypothetical protein